MTSRRWEGRFLFAPLLLATEIEITEVKGRLILLDIVTVTPTEREMELI